MKILVDLDGIVVDTLPRWLERIYENTGIRVKPEQITKWNLNENPPLDQVEPRVIFNILDEEAFNLSLPQMADASHYLHQLHKAGHELIFVTARFGKNCISETIEWLQEMMPWLNVKKKVWFGYDKHEIAADMIIDDKAETLIAYRAKHPNARLVTIDYPYNQHAPADTHRILKNGYEWEAIESYITRITNDLQQH